MTRYIVSQVLDKYNSIAEQFIVIQQALAPLNLTKWQLFKLLMAQIWRETPISLKTTLAVILGLSTVLLLDAYLLHPYFISLKRLGIPQLKPSKGKHTYDYEPMLALAKRDYPNQLWFFSYSGFEFVVFPSAAVNEVRKLPAKTASLVDFLTTVQFGGWRLIGTDDSSNTLHKTASTELARSIGRMGLRRQESAQLAWENVAGSCEDWKTINLFWSILKVTVAVGATGLVGDPLSRDPRWLKAAQRFPVAVGAGLLMSSWLPRILRPLAAMITYIPSLLFYRWMEYLLKPTIRDSMSAILNREEKTKTASSSLIQLLIGKYKEGELSEQQLLRDVITATFESTPTTAVSAYWMITELLAHPELIEELRNEVESVLENGKLPSTQLLELPKMDSFMRESARVNVFHYLGLSRILREDVQFAMGPKLPKGTIVCVDQHHIHNSAAFYEHPEEFDPWRFYKMRQQPGHETRHQYTNNGPDLLTWGDGPQVCPGRIFAGNSIKIMLSHLLMHYDLQMPAGAQKPERQSFPNGSVQPDLKFKMMIRKRKTPPI